MPECGAPEGPTGVFGCCQRASPAESQFGGIVDDAIARLQVEQPNLFNGNRVLDQDAYVQGVARVLQQRYGVCARQGGPEDEVAVKSSNGYSEQFDILFSNGAIRTQGFVVRCLPARF
jgi:hypothetical protein